MEDNLLEEGEIPLASVKVNKLVPPASPDVGILGFHPSVVGLETHPILGVIHWFRPLYLLVGGVVLTPQDSRYAE